MGFPRQDYLIWLPFPSPGDLPNPGIKPVSPALATGFFTIEPLYWYPIKVTTYHWKDRNVISKNKVVSVTLREGNGTPLQYSCLGNPMDGEARYAAVHGVAKSWA